MKTAQTDVWDDSDDGSMPEVKATLNPAHLQSLEQKEAWEKAPRITVDASELKKPGLKDPFPAGALPPQPEEKLPDNLAEMLKLLHSAQVDVDNIPNPQRSVRNPAFMAKWNRLQRIKAHFHALQQGPAPADAIHADHFEAARKGRLAGPRKRADRLAEVHKLLKVPVEKSPLNIRPQTDPVRKRLLAEPKLQAKLRSAQRAVLVYEEFFLLRAQDMYIEDEREAARLKIGQTEDPIERRKLVDDLTRLSSEEMLELERASRADVRKAFAPVREVICELLDLSGACLKVYRQAAESAELELATEWAVPVVATQASKQFTAAEEEIKHQRTRFAPHHNLALPNITGAPVMNPSGLLSWFGL